MPPTNPMLATERERRASYREVFAGGEFRAVFVAHMLSMFGTIVSVIALSVLVYSETGSPLLAALTFALSLLPYAVGGTVLSPIADRFPARRVLVACDLVSAACAAVMVLRGTPVVVLLALRALSSLVAPLFNGVRAASLGDILHGDSYVLGRSLIRIVSQSAQIVGNAGAGLLLVVVSPRAALLVTLVGFLSSALILRFGTKLRPVVTPDHSHGGTLALFRDRRVRGLLALSWLPSALVVVPEGLATPYVAEIGAGPAAIGLLLAAMPVGAVLGELAAGALLGPSARERIVLPVAVAAPLILVAFVFRPAVLPAMVVLCVAGSCSAYRIGLDTWFFDAVPAAVRGRAMTLMLAGMITSQGLAMALGGLVAEYFTARGVIAFAGGAGGIAVLVLVLGVRRDRTTRWIHPDRPDHTVQRRGLMRADRPRCTAGRHASYRGLSQQGARQLVPRGKAGSDAYVGFAGWILSCESQRRSHFRARSNGTA